ncbi:MAG: alpha/beta fold hydrolase [Nitriliruptoraceae bacterium]|nr:alpha/beta fold hydrolase [Nitriliruptoraceae bacterium]
MRRPRRLWPWTVSGSVLVVLAAALLLVAWFLPGSPDGFYRSPASLDDAAAGTVLRVEPFTTGIPPDAEAWRVLYASRDEFDRPIAVSGLIITPTTPADGPRPIITVGHGTTGVDVACAPSLSVRPLSSLPGVEQALAAGWTVAATDYPGLGTRGPHPYLIGETTAHAVLDAARAASSVTGEAPPDVAVWGFSQGAHAALFAGALARDYAPELPVRGVVAFAPPTDLAAIIEANQGTTLGTMLVVSTAVAWSEAREDLELTDVVNDDSIEAARSLAAQCLASPELPIAAIRSIQLRDEVATLGSDGTAAWSDILAANSPSERLQVPTLILQGAADPIMDPQIVGRYAEARCEEGDPIELRLVPAAEHFTLVARTADDAAAWTTDRFAGRAAASSC